MLNHSGALKQWGDTPFAYSTCQPGLSYHRDQDGHIAYLEKRIWPFGKKTCFVLGDPVCPADATDDLISRFLVRFPNSCFFHAQKPATVEALGSRGYYINHFGMDVGLDLSRFTYTGKSKQCLRTTFNHARRAGITVDEVALNETVRQELVVITEGWKARKAQNRRELRFLLRPLAGGPYPGARYFVAKCHKKNIIGFVIFDPIYRHTRIVGYSASVLRDTEHVFENAAGSLQKLPGVLDEIIRCAIEQFKREGFEHLSLGTSPLHNLSDSGQERHSSFTHHFFKFSYEYMNRAYSFKGLAWHKSRYKGDERKVYFASRTPFPVFEIWALLQLAGVRLVF